MDKISLTASMRSNLLSLQNISGQVDLTQNKLSTGKKVNSAIDNPSSYYTALSLNNRADDLNALLDSMGQAVSAIKAATTALESATEFLEQAKAVANQALEGSGTTTKPIEDFIAEGYKVITSDMDTAAIQALITDNAKLVLDGDITLDSGLLIDKSNVTINGNGHKINYRSSNAGEAVIKVDGAGASADIQNIGIQASGEKVYGIQAQNGGSVTLDSSRNIEVSGKGSQKLLNGSMEWAGINDGKGNTQAIVDQIGEEALAATAANEFYAPGVSKNDATFGQGNWYLPSIGEWMNAYGTDFSQVADGWGTSGAVGDNKKAINDTLATLADKGVDAAVLTENFYWSSSEYYWASTNYVYDASWSFKFGTGQRGFPSEYMTEPDIKNYYVRCLLEVDVSTSSIAPKVGDIMYADKTYGSADDYDGSKTVVGVVTEVSADGSSAKIINLKDLTFDNEFYAGNFNPDNPYGGATSNSCHTSQAAWHQDVAAIPPCDTQTLVTICKTVGQITVTNTVPDVVYDASQYNSILNQYDALIKDASYKGINLLQTDKLTVKFNEDNTAGLNVQGKDMNTKALGLTTLNWQSQEDINKSIEELASAINSLRSYSSELGNNYNIITSRQDFTESLINVLTEGADKLTLADMNEESANMLSLQTRQQLAINSLSLASQASQSILKLF